MKRRDLIKAGVGSAALASLSAVWDARPSHAQGSTERRRGTFVAFSDAATIEGVAHRIVMEGAVEFKVGPGQPKVSGGGTFVHFDNASATPKTIIAYGIWGSTKFVNYITGFGTYGRIEASILDVLIDLFPSGAPVVSDVPFRLICNIGVAGITTGEPEGFRLTIPGAPFGTFNPLVPALGLTFISIPH